VDDIFILFSITRFVSNIPAKGFKERVNEFLPELGLIISRITVSFDITIETVNKV